MELETVQIEKPDDVNLILGQTHFIKTVEDIYEAVVTSVPGVEFGIAFCEASAECLIRSDGTDDELRGLAVKNAERIGAGHTFVILMRGAYPINLLPRIKSVPEVCGIFAATANALQVIVAESEQGRGIVGVIDGESPKGVETEEQAEERKEFLRKIGYKR
ncbi:MAG: adenosine-specific kinase [Candidatus Thermoplasmatota archaeon]|nr:adenosine-specific kinase [Candidatus Thermoplasmatota archaeon]